MAASTTQKITNGTLALIHRFCVRFNAGVIIRLKGEEIGVTAEDLAVENGKVTWPNAPAKLNTLTIPKATIAQMESDLESVKPATQPATLFADLSPAEQTAIRQNVATTMFDPELIGAFTK
jgi:hypothetical protein